jgi:LCCL domain
MYTIMINQSMVFLTALFTFAPYVMNTSQAFSQGIKQIEWNTSASEVSNKLDQDFTYLCPSGGSINRVWGTDLYEYSSSICTAAVHAGLINARDGGQVTIRIRPGFKFYNPSVRNNIVSERTRESGASFIFIDVNGNTLLKETPIELIDWNTNASQISNRLDQEFSYQCPPNGVVNRIWGTDLYEYSSSICTAAVHKGIISNKRGGRVTVLIRPGANSYRGTTRNGVTSSNNGSSSSSFSFVLKRSSSSIESPTQTIADIPSEPPTDNVANTSSNCQEADRTFVTAETNNFFLFICGKNKPTYYIGTAKNNSGSIRLPISSTGTKKYTIKNGNASYTLTPQNLTITQNGRVIQKDPILSSQWQ